MPHGESWFSLFPFHERLQSLAHLLSQPVNDEGLTWIAHTQPGVQHIYAALFVLFLIAIMAVVTDTSIRNASGDVLPPERLTLRNFVELFVGTSYSMMSDIMGKQAARHFLPLIGTCAFFIFFSNALGLVPGFIPPTDNLNTTAACAVVIFFATHIYGLKVNGFNHIKHFFGPIINFWALPLMLLMFVIEVISHFARPLSLAIRLMANMTADHKVLGIFLGFMTATVLGVPLFWLPVPTAVYLLGALVVVVQTLVFCLLSAVYIAMAIEHAEH